MLCTPLRHSVPSRYRVMQLPNVQLYEKQTTPAIFLVPSTINLNYWTASDRFSPVLSLFFTKTVAIFVVYSRLWGFLRHSVIISLQYYVLWRRVVWYTSTNLSEKSILFQSWIYTRLYSFKFQNPSIIIFPPRLNSLQWATNFSLSRLHDHTQTNHPR